MSQVANEYGVLEGPIAEKLTPHIRRLEDEIRRACLGLDPVDTLVLESCVILQLTATFSEIRFLKVVGMRKDEHGPGTKEVFGWVL